jgi:hypothetical protein
MANIIETLNTYNVFSPKIRIGNNSDGGYVINESISHCTRRLISIGMGLEDSFERDWFSRYNTPIEAYDGSVTCQTLCDVHQNEINKKIFYINHHVGNLQNQIPLGSIVADKADVLLKVDVEGAEYSIFDNFTFGDNIVGLVLEVHDLYIKENQQKLAEIINTKLSDFVLFHLHGNSWGKTFDLNLSKIQTNGIIIKNFPIVMELSFINKRLLGNWEIENSTFPVNGIDFSNNSAEPDIDLYWVNSL